MVRSRLFPGHDKGQYVKYPYAQYFIAGKTFERIYKKRSINENVITALTEFGRKYGVNLLEMSLFVHSQLITRLRTNRIFYDFLRVRLFSHNFKCDKFFNFTFYFCFSDHDIRIFPHSTL